MQEGRRINPNMKVVCGGIGLKKMAPRFPTAEREGQGGGDGRESLGKDSNTGPPRNGYWKCSVLRPHLWHWDHLRKEEGKKVFRRGASSLVAALAYLHQSQRAVACSSSSKTQQ